MCVDLVFQIHTQCLTNCAGNSHNSSNQTRPCLPSRLPWFSRWRHHVPFPTFPTCNANYYPNTSSNVCMNWHLCKCGGGVPPSPSDDFLCVCLGWTIIPTDFWTPPHLVCWLQHYSGPSENWPLVNHIFFLGCIFSSCKQEWASSSTRGEAAALCISHSCGSSKPLLTCTYYCIPAKPALIIGSGRSSYVIRDEWYRQNGWISKN